MTMNDLALLTELVNSPTSLADELGIPCPLVATDDEPGDSLEGEVAPVLDRQRAVARQINCRP